MIDRHDKDPPEKPGEAILALAKFSHIGVTMAASVLIGVFVGRFLDRRLDTSPWLLLIFSFLGVAAALRTLFRLAGSEGADKDDADKEE